MRERRFRHLSLLFGLFVALAVQLVLYSFNIPTGTLLLISLGCATAAYAALEKRSQM